MVSGIARAATADAAAVCVILLRLSAWRLLLADPPQTAHGVPELSAALRCSCQAEQQAIQLGDRPGSRCAVSEDINRWAKCRSRRVSEFAGHIDRTQTTQAGH